MSDASERDVPDPPSDRSRLKKVGFAAAAVAIALSLVAVVFELIGRYYLYSRETALVRDPDHRMTPRSDDDINSDGIRCIFEADRFRPDDFNVIFLGDSFTFGLRLPYDKTIPYQFEKIAGRLQPDRRIKTANFGWTSSCPLLSYRLLKDVGEKYRPKLVILCIDMTDFRDEILYRRLLARRGVYRLIHVMPATLVAFKSAAKKLTGEATQEWLFDYPHDKFFATSKPLSQTRPLFAYIQESIDRIYEFCRTELGVRLVVIVFPRSYQYSRTECPRNWEAASYEVLGPYVHEPFKYFDEIRGKVAYPIHSLLPAFQKTDISPTCFVNDPHWNENGALVAARAIYTCCLEDGCLK